MSYRWGTSAESFGNPNNLGEDLVFEEVRMIPSLEFALLKQLRARLKLKTDSSIVPCSSCELSISNTTFNNGY